MIPKYVKCLLILDKTCAIEGLAAYLEQNPDLLLADETIDNLWHHMELALNLTVIGGITTYSMMTFSVLALVIVLWQNKVIRQLPGTVKMRLLTFMIYAPLTLGLYITIHM